MTNSEMGITGKPLQKLVDYYEEIIMRAPEGTPRGPGSVELLAGWLQRTYPYVNDEQQAFNVIVRTPDLAENREAFAQFCETLSFVGSCTSQSKPNTGLSYVASNPADTVQSAEQVLELEIDFEVVDAKLDEPQYAVQFEFDPIIPFSASSATVRHQIMGAGLDGINLNLNVTSDNGDFTAYVIPEFVLSGTAQSPKMVTVGTPVQFSDPSGVPRHYQLLLGLGAGDQYSLFGSYGTQ